MQAEPLRRLTQAIVFRCTLRKDALEEEEEEDSMKKMEKQACGHQEQLKRGAWGCCPLVYPTTCASASRNQVVRLGVLLSVRLN